MHQIDDLLFSKTNQTPPDIVNRPVEVQSLSVDNSQIENQQNEQGNDTNIDSYGDFQNQKEEPEQVKVEEKSQTSDSSVDEYGNPVNKDTKMYSAEEVQKMIRERLSRVKSEKSQQNYQEPSFEQYQPNNQPKNIPQEDSWEAQLESFIDKRLEQKQIEIEKQKWQQKETQKQYEFEQKFTSGMAKYQDFHDVVSGKPITDSMMLGIRNLENPASFVYAVSKTQPTELDRISRIEDPYIQASEMGKLHERMVKDRKRVSSAPKPAEVIHGDLGVKNSNSIPTNVNSSDYQSYITSRINAYGLQKRK